MLEELGMLNRILSCWQVLALLILNDGLPPSLQAQRPRALSVPTTPPDELFLEPPGSVVLPDSGSPLKKIGEWAWGPCKSAKIEGTLAFVGNGRTFQILDITDPQAPTIIAEYVAPWLIRDIEIKDNKAYLVAGPLVILDLEDPARPVWLGQVSISGAALRVSVADSMAYVSTVWGTVVIVDISDPHVPYVRSSVPIPGEFIYNVEHRGTTVYATSREWPELWVIDAADPDNPVAFNPPDVYGSALLVADTLLIDAWAFYLKIYSIADPLNPVLLGTGNFSPGSSLAVKGSYMFAMREDSGLTVVDISDPTQPQIISQFTPSVATYSSEPPHIAVSGDVVIATCEAGAILLHETGDVLSEVSFVPTGGVVYDVVIREPYVFAACGRGGLWILDISDPTRPIAVGNANPALTMGGGPVSDVAVSGDFAYLVVWSDRQEYPGRGVWAIDISDPINTMVRGHHRSIAAYSQTYYQNQLAIKGNLLLVTQVQSGAVDSVVAVVDVSDVDSLQQVGVYLSQFSPLGIDVSDDSLFVLATDYGGMRVVDFHSPQSPFEIGSFPNGGVVRGVALKDTLAFADAVDDFKVLSISDPANPIVIGETPRTVGGSFIGIDMVADSTFVYWAEDYTGIYDVSNVNAPVSLAEYFQQDSPKELTPKVGLSSRLVRSALSSTC